MIIQYSKTSFLTHPLAMAKFIAGDKNDLHDIILLRTARILMKENFNPVEVKNYLKEMRQEEFVPMNSLPGIQLPGNKPGHLFGKFLYFIVRCFKPNLMVETGVAHGVSSWTILNAMHRNDKGKLFSIDLPDLDLKSYNPGNISQTSGWVVPDLLRTRWELQLGSSQDLLPRLMDKLKLADIFFHDSDHSYDNMMFEFETVLPHIKSPGLIISDDVHKNESFSHFVSKHGLTGIQFLTKGGVALK